MQENLLNGEAMVIKLDDVLPEYPEFAAGIRRAPDRGWTLSQSETELALRNALRYVPEKYHEQLIPEFMEELRTRGRIYAYRFRPAGRIWGRPIETYEGKCLAGKAFQVMMDNNLDFETALYPYELVTYGETGQMLYSYKLTFTLPTDAGRLEYLRGRTFQVQRVPFAEKYFPDFKLS